MVEKLREHFRIIWAIAAKDIVDAIKNKTTLSAIGAVLFLIVFYQILPKIENGDPLPRLVLYDAGSSSLVGRLEDSNEFDYVEANSPSWMQRYIGHRDFVVLGMTLPLNFDQSLAGESSLVLEGYVVHWASDTDVSNLKTFFEEQLQDVVGRSVQINLDGNIVFTQSDSRGMPFLISAMLVLALMMIGISLIPNLMLEERVSKTMDTLLVSPASEWHLVAGKAVSGIFFCVLALSIAFMFNTALITHWWLAIMAGICGSLFVASLGLLLGSIIEIRQQLILWAWPILISLIGPLFLSVLTDILPEGVISALGWVPSVALAKIFRVSFTENARLSDFGSELALVIGATALLLAGVVFVIRRSDR